ncbi:hypothetical protein HMPREF1624_05640 [Sporothrix schenckii ATCC 58251]|uniref:Uncharacterized protein n=1 Tax=Sporothrix schenckii (strain ATCC 58251 / de Perez 2211183) TaxID=1391915 RepID=U7PPH0_SPOS1|nr:hypothetical protein HMPREF1624_05640 [Sporothrix schenckii ATCC 58251]
MPHMPRRALSLATLAALAVPALAAGKLNVYWGQSGDRTLAQVCQEDALDYVTLSFINESPENDGATNYPGMEFAAHCPGTMYEVDGEASNLIKGCTDIQEGIPVCQALGTKVLLSIGGVFDTVLANYNVTTEANGRYFADFLWGAFGPYNATFGGPRPFDLGATVHNAVDGFDFDIEAIFPSEAPWIALIDQLRGYWAADAPYLVTGAPQCPIVSDASLPMKHMIAEAQFDLIWVQFYNNPECDGTTSAFNFDEWVDFLPGTRSAHAQLYIGLPADQGASGYLDEATLRSILNTYGTSPSFGGVMLWDEYLSYTNTNASATSTESYADLVKEVLAGVPTPSPSSSSSLSSSVPATSSVSSTSSPSSTPSPTPCSNPYTVQPTDDCYDIAAAHNTTVGQILALNPALNRFCDLTAGQAICLPEQCTRYYTVVPQDTCYKIDTLFGISFDQLLAWNPNAINADCTNLNVGQVLCVSTGNTTTSASSSATSSTAPTSSSAASASASPTPVACAKYYTVAGGDSCYKIDTKYGLTFAELQALNPTVGINKDCTNLQPGEVLCVAAVLPSSSASASTSSRVSSSVSVPLSTGATTSYSSATSYSSGFSTITTSSQSYIWSNSTSVGTSSMLSIN